MAFCSNCGSRLEEAVKFCENCGTAVLAAQPAAAVQPPAVAADAAASAVADTPQAAVVPAVTESAAAPVQQQAAETAAAPPGPADTAQRAAELPAAQREDSVSVTEQALAETAPVAQQTELVTTPEQPAAETAQQAVTPPPGNAKSPAAAFCYKCGVRLEEGVKFCENCGAAIHTAKIVFPPIQPAAVLKAVSEKAGRVYKTRKKQVLVLAISLAILVVIITVVKNTGGNSSAYSVGRTTTQTPPSNTGSSSGGSTYTQKTPADFGASGYYEKVTKNNSGDTVFLYNTYIAHGGKGTLLYRAFESYAASLGYYITDISSDTPVSRAEYTRKAIFAEDVLLMEAHNADVLMSIFFETNSLFIINNDRNAGTYCVEMWTLQKYK